jgi:hypothetical protein
MLVQNYVHTYIRTYKTYVKLYIHKIVNIKCPQGT